MDIGAINARVLSNGQTRGEYLAALNGQYSQPDVDYSNACKRRWPDIPYGSESARQSVDIYLPDAGDGPFPAILWVHGGGWFMGGRSDFGLSYVLPFLGDGFAVASIGYRLALDAVFPEPVYDVIAATELLESRADEFSLDQKRFVMMSGSAGSTIAALAALWARGVKAVVLSCPILDFTAIRAQFNEIGLKRGRFAYPDEDTSIEALFLGGSTLERPEAARESAPKNHIKKELHVPRFLLLHGTMDIDTPYLQSVQFAEAVRETLGEGRAEAVLLPDTGHDGGLFDAPEIFDKKLSFIREATNLDE